MGIAWAKRYEKFSFKKLIECDQLARTEGEVRTGLKSHNCEVVVTFHGNGILLFDSVLCFYSMAFDFSVKFLCESHLNSTGTATAGGQVKTFSKFKNITSKFIFLGDCPVSSKELCLGEQKMQIFIVMW